MVAADYGHLPGVRVAVRNLAGAPAKDVSFESSEPIESPNGTIISNLPYLEKGLSFLEPGASIGRPWGPVSEIVPMLRQKGLTDGIGAKTSHKDSAGESYEAQWTLEPLPFEDSGIEGCKGMNGPVNAVRGLGAHNVADNVEGDGRRKTASGG